MYKINKQKKWNCVYLFNCKCRACFFHINDFVVLITDKYSGVFVHYHEKQVRVDMDFRILKSQTSKKGKCNKIFSAIDDSSKTFELTWPDMN